jgi:uncharacterized protein YeaO (DUF488 family)
LHILESKNLGRLYSGNVINTHSAPLVSRPFSTLKTSLLMATIKIKRAYEPKSTVDGFRILVDRLWPRGVKKEDAHIDVWMKEIAPSSQLRKWFDHDEKKWAAFNTKYTAELKKSTALDDLLAFIKAHKTITLVYGAKDEEHNQAVVLKSFLDNW